MQKKSLKRILSALLCAVMLLGCGATAFAAGTAADGSTKSALGTDKPALRYFVTNVGWRWAEKIPLYNETRETFYLDVSGSENAVVAAEAVSADLSYNGVLSQFKPAAAEVKADGRTGFNSAKLFYFFANEITGYPEAQLFVKAAKEGKVRVTLSAVQEDGSAVDLASAETAVKAGEQELKLKLTRAYDNGEDEQDFVAYQWPKRKGGTVRLTVEGEGVTVTIGGDKASNVSVPFTDDDETGYNGKLTVDGKAYNATMYWLTDKLYINYTVSETNDTWLSVPADSAYTVDKNGAAAFEGFTFLNESAGLKNGLEQQYDGSGKHTQPFPSTRHVVVDTVPVTGVSDLLYMPAEKTLKYDLYLPTGGVKNGEKPPVIIFLHGYSGSYATLETFMVDMLEEGYAVAGVDFRRSPSNFSPDFQHDIKGAIRSIRANADKLGVDGERIGVYGASNGGFTSLMMLLTNENDTFMEGTVGGNLGVSSRIQAGLVGYGASDYLYFGADQRTDNANNEDLLRGMITGGDGENAPCAQMTGWYGVGKGLLMLRNYKEARDEAEANGTLKEFLSKDYTFTVDDAYLEKWFPWDLGGGLFAAGVTATKGTYTYTHKELEKALDDTAKASPITWVSPDDSPVGMYAGYGGTQNITNTQSVRTLQALSEAGVEGFLYANTLGNYGKDAEVQASMKNFMDEYLKNGPSGVKIALTLDKKTAAVNYHSVTTENTLKKQGGEYLIPLDFVAQQLGVTVNGTEGVKTISGAAYANADTVKALTGAAVTVWDKFDMVTVTKADAVYAPVSKTVEPTKTSAYGEYSGYGEETYPNYVKKSVYVEVPASYEGAAKSDPDYEGDTIKLAVDYVLPADENGKVIEGKLPTVLLASRGGRFSETDTNGNGPVAMNLIKHGYAYMVIEMRGCGASFGVNNSFSSIENRMDIKYIMENWAPEQAWYNGKFAMMGGSNRGLIQGAAAAVGIKGLVGITPVVCDMDLYYQNFPNGVSSALTGMNGAANTTGLSGTKKDAEIKSYEEWIKEPKVAFVDDDPDGKQAYEAYKIQTEKNMSFSTYMILPNMLRDTENKFMYGEKVEQTIAPMEYTSEIIKSGVKTHQLAGYYDSNVTLQTAMANCWDENGTIVMGPWNHNGAIRGTYDENLYPNSNFDVAADYLRWFDYCLKDIDNGYDEAPRFNYYVVGAAKGTEWRYADSMSPDNAVWSDLYLSAEGADLADALLLDGAQSNNGCLTIAKPDASGSVTYRADAAVELPSDYNAFTIKSDMDMREGVDSKALTFTSAPLATSAEIVGIPTIDLWVSSENADDCDFIAYLELVDADGTSHYLSRAYMRASHRETAANAMWDSIDAMKGRFHVSTIESMEKGVEAGLAEPVKLEFIFDLVSVNVKAGQSIRVSVTCANTKLSQHYMLYDYDEAKGEYVLKSDADMPVISLYTGADKASKISLPVIQKKSNVFNGTVTLSDGSYTGPGTMYLFGENWYVSYNGCWKRLPLGSKLSEYTVKNNAAVFANAGFTFLPEGSPIANGVVQSYKGGAANTQPFPTKYQMYVDTVPVQAVSDHLYLPAERELYIDFFKPDRSTGSDPLILFIHGYGGTTTAIDDFLTEAVSKGYAVAGIDMRNSPPNFCPDYYQDNKGDIRFLRANAKELGIDPDRFCTYGQSLGGFTALMAAVSNGVESLEGTVGGNTGVSSDIQGAIVGYGASDFINFGADQRKDNSGNQALLASMITGGDGESAPCAQMIDWYGPGKGYLMLRNYLAEREAAEENGTLAQFLAKDYTFTIDDAYLDKWFSMGISSGLFGITNTATKGTYTFTHAELEAAIERAKEVSPLYYIDENDPTILLYAGFGGPQNITNGQSIRTLAAYQDAGLKAYYVGNSLGNYGREESNRAMMWKYLENYFPAYGNTANAFSDVKSGDWFYKSVSYCCEKGLFGGMGDGTFAPNKTMTAAQLVTVLYRIAGGTGETTGSSWYSAAQKWAEDNGIVTAFRPDAEVSRGSFIAMLYKTIALTGKYDTAVTDDMRDSLKKAADYKSIAGADIDASAWAVASGLIVGTDANTLTVSPSSMVSRAEVCTMLMRYYEGLNA